MGRRNYWGRGFFRLWIVLALLWVVPIGIGAAIEMVKDLRPISAPATIHLGVREAVALTLTNDERGAEEQWQHAVDKRNLLLGNTTVYVLAMLAVVFLPPLMLLLPGLVIAGAGQTSSRRTRQSR